MWFDILKLYPTQFDERGGITYAFTQDWLLVFTKHYMDTLDDRTRRIMYKPITPNDVVNLVIPQIPKGGTSAETYWFYLNDDAKDFAYTIIDVLYSPEDIIKGTRLKVKDFEDEKGQHRNQAIVFHHVNGHDIKTNKAHGYNAEYDILNVYHKKGIKRGHHEKRKSREKRRPKMPKDIFPKQKRRQNEP